MRQWIAALTLRVAWGLALAVLLALPLASPSCASDGFWAAVKKPGAIILLRHSYSPESPPDTDLVNLKNCSTQRNLDETGRAQARRIGDEFRKHGFKNASIHSSQYCRTLETARLLNIGRVQELAALNQTFFAQPFAMREAADKTKHHEGVTGAAAYGSGHACHQHPGARWCQSRVGRDDGGAVRSIGQRRGRGPLDGEVIGDIHTPR